SCVVYTVHIEAHTRIDSVIDQSERCAETANVEGGVAGVGCVQLDRRNQFFQAVDVECTGVVSACAGNYGNRNRNLLCCFSSAAGSYRDFIAKAVIDELNLEGFIGQLIDFHFLGPVSHQAYRDGKRKLLTGCYAELSFGVGDGVNACSFDRHSCTGKWRTVAIGYHAIDRLSERDSTNQQK